MFLSLTFFNLTSLYLTAFLFTRKAHGKFSVSLKRAGFNISTLFHRNKEKEVVVISPAKISRACKIVRPVV